MEAAAFGVAMVTLGNYRKADSRAEMDTNDGSESELLLAEMGKWKPEESTKDSYG